MLTRDNKFNVLASRQSSGNVIECPGCGNELPAQYFEVDHILPLSKGGSDDISNYMLLCGPCNRSKGDSLTLEELQAKNISSRKCIIAKQQHVLSKMPIARSMIL